jgi:hypothetical protein
VRFAPYTKRRGARISWFGLKTKVDGFPSSASKLVASGFLLWASKPVVIVWRFGPQNHHDSFLVWVSKSSGLRFVGCATKLIGE